MIVCAEHLYEPVSLGGPRFHANSKIEGKEFFM